MMDGAAASDAAIFPSLWATLKEPPLEGGLPPDPVQVGIGEAFGDSFAKSFEPSNETEQLLVQVSQLLEGLGSDATSRTVAAVSGTIADLLLKSSQQLECPSEEPVQQATIQKTVVEASQLLEGLELKTTTAVIHDLLLH